MHIQDFKLVNGNGPMKATFVVLRYKPQYRNDPDHWEEMHCNYFADSAKNTRWIGYPSCPFQTRDGEKKYKRLYSFGKARKKEIEDELWPLIDAELAKHNHVQLQPSTPFFDDSSCPF